MANAKERPEQKAAEKPPTGPAALPEDRAPVFSSRGYWTALAISALTLAIAVGFQADYLPVVADWFRLATIVLALVVIAFVLLALGRRGRVVHRTVRGTKRAVSGMAEGVRARGEAAEGSVGRFFTRLAKVIKWIVLLPWHIVVWAWYTGEKLFWRILLILYDVVYYPLYAAWILVHFALRVALRLVVFALKVAWTILRIPTRVWPFRKWWREKKMPEIMGQWHAVVRHRRHVKAMKMERLRRLAALRGEDPDRFQADHEIRRGFPLPHPERARVRIRKRIGYISEVQRARREGRPLPRHLKEGEEPRRRFGRRERKKEAGDEPPAAPPAEQKATAPSEAPARRKGRKEKAVPKDSDLGEPSSV